ncbi:ABC transporter permease [Adhaeribacter rhizoryzae]|uniref:FtsX-like permease family protein n=1 Tax=Adhaeribacter rhizoryzae TaxID=2607907 RepID=A0A5M6D8M9_9BACT|nr:ABC transporter permease [Adhaeribacter rhizoryzae]KAA5542840.1 FtsX-like permease family protein [Adhaeribacter rhizoryzae]
MFKNYLKIAFRNLWRNKTFSAINILGLAIGLATCLIISLFVVHELSYDQYHEKADRLVRVIFRASINGDKIKEAVVMPPVAKTLQADYPEVQAATRIRQGGEPMVTYGDKAFKETSLAHVDANFFEVFTLPLLQGNPKTALVEPYTVVISRATAQKYFGASNPIGKVLNFKTWKKTYRVTGVFDKIPANTHFHFDLIASLASDQEAKSSSWMTSNYFTYLVLPKGYDYKKLEAKLPQVIEKYMGPQILQAMGMSLAEFRKKGNQIGLFLEPVTSIHLHSESTNDIEPVGDIRYVYVFGAIALFMLLIACINFMNLSTAGASKRAREVGIRKVLGSVKLQLVRQFLLESILVTVVALVLAILLVQLALPVFNQLAGKNLEFNLLAHPALLPGLLVFGLFIGVLAGSYPAFFLSSFQPVTVLKGKITSAKSSLNLRSGLVVFQFFISITLMISTVLVYQQLRYIWNKELGYNKDQVLILPETWVLGGNEKAFLNQLAQDSRVVSMSASGYLPVGPTYGNNNMIYTEDNPNQLVKTLKYEVDHQYIATLGMQLIAGRNFSEDLTSDSLSVILNETAVRTYGWEKDPLGRRLTDFINNDGAKKNYRVIGVIKDFHFKSLHERISPLMMVLGRHSGSIIVKAKTSDMAGLLAAMETNWKNLTADSPFTYSFLDERFQATYETERKTGTILGIFASLTIFIACLGLLGLAIFMAEQRTKEIGIRKVLGASVTNILTLLSKDFLKLVLIANLIAWPLAWWGMRQWLQDFEYRINISPGIFALAGVAALLIALLTISIQAVRAALSNPVNSLRNE